MATLPETGDGYYFLPRYPVDTVNGLRNDSSLIVPAPGQPIDTLKVRMTTTQKKSGGHEIRVLVEPFAFAPNISGSTKTQTFFLFPIEFGRLVSGGGVVSNVVATASVAEHPAFFIPEPVTGTDFIGGIFVQNNAADPVEPMICFGGVVTIYTDN